MLPPEACDEPDCAEYKADYDIELWGWAGDPDPNALLQIFRCDAIGSSSDSQYCNPEFDAMYDTQTNAATAEERKTILAEMQNLIYDEAVYDIVFYDANLAAYRTDHFGGWQNQPANGTPLFTYSTLQYTVLTDATAQPSPTAAPSAEPGASAAPTPAPDGGGSDDSGNLVMTYALFIGAIIVVGRDRADVHLPPPLGPRRRQGRGGIAARRP